MAALHHSRRTSIVALVVALLALPLLAQGVTITTTGGVVRLKVPRLPILEGEVLERLLAGRSVDLEYHLTLSLGRGGRTLAHTRQTYKVSYDLWEERFAVTRVGTPPRSVSRLAARDAELWCVEALGIERASIGPLEGSTPRVWIRLEYKALDDPAPAHETESGPLTLRSLINALSRKQGAGDRSQVLEAGPFSLSD